MKLILALALLLLSGAARAEEPIPVPLRGIEIQGQLGAQVPLMVPFVDHDGRPVTLGDYLRPGRPLILTLNYYGCPTLCSFVMQGALDGIKGLAFTAGREYQIATISIDPREGPELARMKRSTFLQHLGRAGEGVWPFLTGKEADIKAVADAVGFRFRWDEKTQQYAHAAGIFVITPEGKVSQVLYGIEYRPRDLRLALVEASRGAIGSAMDRLLLFCYHYDPQIRIYRMTPMGIMRLGGVVIFCSLCLLLIVMWRRERRTQVVHE
jgi:protein SCO1/2